MTHSYCLPRLLEAKCELWFQSAAVELPPTGPSFGARLANHLPFEGETEAPWVWYEPNYLAVRSELPIGGFAAHQRRLFSALNLYIEATRPEAVQSVFLRYRFSLPAAALSEAWGNAPLPLVGTRPPAPQCLQVSLSPEPSSSPHVEVELHCLETDAVHYDIANPSGWLDDLHARMETEFQKLCAVPSLSKVP